MHTADILASQNPPVGQPPTVQPPAMSLSARTLCDPKTDQMLFHWLPERKLASRYLDNIRVCSFRTWASVSWRFFKLFIQKAFDFTQSLKYSWIQAFNRSASRTIFKGHHSSLLCVPVLKHFHFFFYISGYYVSLFTRTATPQPLHVERSRTIQWSGA